ncbi:MAG: cytochrome bd-I oxidase subunit CydX [Pseudomonadota bacterium]
MWYFSWLLGLPLAAAFAVVNAMWLEMQRDRRLTGEKDDDDEDANQQPPSNTHKPDDTPPS